MEASNEWKKFTNLGKDPREVKGSCEGVQEPSIEGVSGYCGASRIVCVSCVVCVGEVWHRGHAEPPPVHVFQRLCSR